MDSISAINQADMSTDDNVAIPGGGRAQAVNKIRGCRTAQPSHIFVHHVAVLESRLVLRRQSIPLPEPTIVFVLLGVFMCELTVVIVEPSIIVLAPLILVFPGRNCRGTP